MFENFVTCHTRGIAVAMKASRTAYNVQYSCMTKPPKMPHLEKPHSRDHAAHGYSRCGNFGGSVFAVNLDFLVA